MLANLSRQDLVLPPFPEKSLRLWIFGKEKLTHFQFSLHTRYWNPFSFQKSSREVSVRQTMSCSAFIFLRTMRISDMQLDQKELLAIMNPLYFVIKLLRTYHEKKPQDNLFLTGLCNLDKHIQLYNLCLNK